MENHGIIFGIRARFKFVAECVSVCFASVNARVVTVIISSAYLYDIYVVSERRFCDDVAAKVEVGFNAEFFNGVFALFGYRVAVRRAVKNAVLNCFSVFRNRAAEVSHV